MHVPGRQSSASLTRDLSPVTARKSFYIVLHVCTHFPSYNLPVQGHLHCAWSGG
jgi:hypothetical protein